jgi:hypothetical protein
MYEEWKCLFCLALVCLGGDIMLGLRGCMSQHDYCPDHNRDISTYCCVLRPQCCQPNEETLEVSHVSIVVPVSSENNRCTRNRKTHVKHNYCLHHNRIHSFLLLFSSHCTAS